MLSYIAESASVNLDASVIVSVDGWRRRKQDGNGARADNSWYEHLDGPSCQAFECNGKNRTQAIVW